MGRITALMLWLTLCGVAFGQTATNFSTTVSSVGGTGITLVGSVPSGTLTFGIYSSGCASCTAPSYGVISQFNSANGFLIYTPNSGFTGTDTFTFTAIQNGTTSSSQATVTITVTNAKTTISDYLLNPDGSSRGGVVTFLLTQPTTSNDGILPASASVSANVNASTGLFTVSVYPSRYLSPQAYYQVWWGTSTNLRRELIGVYDIPASASTITLGPYKVTNTNLANNFTFVNLSALQALITRDFLTAVYNNGTLVGSRPSINFIPGANISLTIADNSGSNRVDVTISDPTGGSGGTVGSATSGQIAEYNGTTSVTGKAFGGANKVLGINSSNNGHEYKTLTAGTGIGITHSTGGVTIANTGVPSLNGLATTTGQTFAAQTSTCGTGFAISSSGTQHSFCVPYASASATGLVTATSTAQTIAGAKTITGFGTSDIPLTVKQYASGNSVLQQWQDSSGTDVAELAISSAANAGLWTNKLAVGNIVSAPVTGYLINAGHTFTADQSAGMLLNIANTANDAVGSNRGMYVLYAMSGTGTINSSGNRNAAIDFEWRYDSSGTVVSALGMRGGVALNNTGTITNARNYYSTSELAGGGTITNYTHFYAAAPTLTSGTITTQYGLYIESLTGATTNWGVYLAGTNGSSTGGFWEFRGASTPSLSGSGNGRIYYNSSNTRFEASGNGGAYGVLPIMLTATATLDFPSTSASSSQDLTVTVTGATTGKAVYIGAPNGSVNSNCAFFAWVSASNTVTVRHINNSGSSVDPASGSFTVYVMQ